MRLFSHCALLALLVCAAAHAADPAARVATAHVADPAVVIAAAHVAPAAASAAAARAADAAAPTVGVQQQRAFLTQFGAQIAGLQPPVFAVTAESAASADGDAGVAGARGAAAAGVSAHAASADVSTRAASAGVSARAASASAVARAVASASHRAGAAATTISATVDSHATRAAGRLCRATRTRYLYEGDHRQWRQDAVYGLVWPAARCDVAATAIALLQPVPDSDLIEAFDALGALLPRARLLMAGNSGCAHLRSVPFRLTGIGVSAPPQGAEEMLVLRFESDRNSIAHVWVRRRAQELSAWSVACAAG